MANMVYAVAALKTFETGAERVIGRHEEPALMRMFESALFDICVRLRPAVKEVNTITWAVNLDVSEPLAHQMLEAAVVQKVLSQLNLTKDDPEIYVRILSALTTLLPRLTQN